MSFYIRKPRRSVHIWGPVSYRFGSHYNARPSKRKKSGSSCLGTIIMLLFAAFVIYIIASL